MIKLSLPSIWKAEFSFEDHSIQASNKFVPNWYIKYHDTIIETE